MNTKQPIPNSLKFYRKQAGLRQIDVAAKLGFTSYDRISMWENGLSFPSVTNLFRLAAIYKTNPRNLYEAFFKIIEMGLQTNTDFLRSADGNVFPLEETHSAESEQ